MQVAEIDRSVQVNTTGVMRSREFTMSASKVAKSAQILSETLYNDRKLAVVREYSTNGHDAHIMVGQPDRSIHVTLPTALSPIFKVRDFGPGIPENDIYNVYTSYFESTKESESDMNGFLGLGSKAGFAYADTFTVISIIDSARLKEAITYVESVLIPRLKSEQVSDHEIAEQQETLGALCSAYAKIEGSGKNWKSVYTAYKNNKLIPCMDKQFEETTGEETGVEVLIPLDESRDRNAIANFNNTAMNFYRHFSPRPVFTGNSQIDSKIDNYQARVPTYQGKTPEGVKWSIYNSPSCDSGRSLAVMGNVAYPIDHLLWNTSTERLNRALVEQGNMVLEFPVGMVVNHPSRESLDRSGQTVGGLKRAVKRIMIAVRKEIRKTLATAPNMWSARVVYQRASVIPTYLRNIAIPKPLFQGKPITLSITGGRLSQIINESLGLDETVVSGLISTLEDSLDMKYESTENRFRKQFEIEKQYAAIRAGFLMRLYTDLRKADDQKMPKFEEVKGCTPQGGLVLALGVSTEFPSAGRLNQYARGVMKEAESRFYERVIMMVFPTRTALEAFVEHEEIKGAPTFDIKDVKPLAPIGSGPNLVARGKAKSKEFVFNRATYPDHQSARSNSWDTTEVDLENGEGFYVLIDKFELSRCERNQQTGFITAPQFGLSRGNGNAKLREFLNTLETSGIAVPTVYGFRESRTDVTKLGSGWKPFGEWVKSTVQAHILVANQQRANHDAARMVETFYSDLIPIEAELPDGPLRTLVTALRDYLLPSGHSAFHLDGVKSLMPTQAYNAATVSATVDFEAMVDAVQGHYPFIMSIGHRLNSDCFLFPVWDTVIKPIAPHSNRKKKKMSLYDVAIHEKAVSNYKQAVEDFERKTKFVADTRAKFLKYVSAFPV